MRSTLVNSATCIAAGVAVAILSLVGAGSAGAAEGDYPNRAVKIVVPYAAGATTDIVARLIAKSLEENWKQSVYVENLPGGSGLTGAATVSRAAPDGYTLVIVTSSHVIGPALMKSPPFDPIAAFAPVGLMIKAQTVIVGSPQLGVASIADLVAKAKDRELGYGTAGVGSMYHVTMERFAKLSGAKLQHVPYRGSGPAMNDVMGGHLPIQVGSVAFNKDFVITGKVNGLASAGEKRHPALPSVPTLSELGYPIVSSEWWALLAPAGTPNAVLDKVSKDVGAILNTAFFKDKMPTEDVTPSTPDELMSFLKNESEVWGKGARDAGIQME